MASKSSGDRGDCEIEPMDFHEDLATSNSNVSDSQFDTVVGHIEDIIMEDEFQSVQTKFLAKYYTEFEDTEENKLSYTGIHKEYVELVEKYLDYQLRQRVPDFSMENFLRQVMSRKNELEGEVFEILLTFSDFLLFKEMVLDFRAEKEGRAVDLSSGLTVTSLSVDPAINPSISNISLQPSQ